MIRDDDTPEDLTYRELGEVVRTRLELEADGVDARRFGAMWRNIDQALDAAAPHGIGARFRGWLERYRGHLLTGVVTAGAVAALALVIRPVERVEVPVAGTTVVRGSISVQPAALREAPAIEMLDTPGGDGTVINLQDEDGHTAVIWVTPADTVEDI